jgi:dihydrofolate reductase
MEFILACNTNHIIGINNNLPWHLPEDLQHFKNLTINNIVIMGKKTFESINSKPLNKRINIVITNNTNNYISSDNLFFTTADNVYNIINKFNDKKIFVIGGNQIFKLFKDQCISIHLTLVYIDVPESEQVVKYNYLDHNLQIVNESEIYVSKLGIKYKFITLK